MTSSFEMPETEGRRDQGPNTQNRKGQAYTSFNKDCQKDFNLRRYKNQPVLIINKMIRPVRDEKECHII
jgi:hypothetical protein